MDEKDQRQYRLLVRTPVHKLIPSLAAPTVLSMMVSMIYNLADAFFVGRLGTSASASIGILMSVQAIFQAIGFMFGHGAGSVISLELGKGNHEEADKTASLAFFSVIIVGVTLSLFGLVFLTPLMRLLGSTETILPYAKNYGFFMMIGGPALALSCVLNNILRYEGKAFYAMIGLVTGNILNIIGDPVLMFGCGLGITGAGLSTAVSMYISLFILLFMFLRHVAISRISVRYFEWNRRRLLRVIRTGLPSLIRQGLNSVSTITLNVSASTYGDAAIAAMTIVGRVAMFVSSFMIGIGQGFQPVSAFNFSAKKYGRIREAYRFTIVLSEIILGIIAVFGMFFPEPIIRLFRNDPDVIAIGERALRYYLIGTLFAPCSVATNMLFQSIGKSRTASFTACMRSGLYFIPLIILLPRAIGLAGVECSQMIADILSTLSCIPIAASFFRSIPHTDERAPIDEIYDKSISPSAEEHAG